VVSFTLLPLYPRGKSPRYPSHMRLGGPLCLSGRYGEVKIINSTGTDAGEWLVLCPGSINPKEIAPPQVPKGWVGPRVGVKTAGKRKIFAMSGIEPGSPSPAIIYTGSLVSLATLFVVYLRLSVSSMGIQVNKAFN
jgi:hypothetical protein